MTTKLDIAKSMDRFWCIEPERGEAIASVLAGLSAELNAAAAGAGSSQPVEVDDKIAVIRVDGPMMKGYSSFGNNCSTVRIREQLRAASNDPEVGSILMVFDSPGGQVAGTHDLAEDVRKVASKKPVTAYVEDMCCSAALWVASQATRIVASPAAVIGSIGCYTLVDDTSALFAINGVHRNLVSSGELKGAGVSGIPIPASYLAEAQRGVDDICERFCSAIASGRNLSEEKVKKLATGQVWTAAEAKRLGLVDSLADKDSVLIQMQRGSNPAKAAAAGTGPKHMATETQDKPGFMTRFSSFLKGEGFDIDAASAGSQPETAAATTPPEPDPAFLARLEQLEKESAAKDLVNAKAAEVMAETATQQFVDLLVATGRAMPAEREEIGALYSDALKADGGGKFQIDAEGNLVKGKMTERVEAAYAKKPQVDMSTPQISSVAGAKVLSSDDRPAFAESWLGSTETGRKTLARLNSQEAK